MRPSHKRPWLLFTLFTVLASLAGASLWMWKDAPRELKRDDVAGREAWEFARLRDPRTNRIPENIRARELAFATSLPSAEDLRGLGKGGAAMVQTWAPRGPNNQGGRTRALAFDVSDNTDNTIFAGGASGGLWRTTNGGTSWTRVTSVDDHPSVTSIAQDTRAGQTSTWYYSTGEINSSAGGGGGASYLGRGLFKSTNGGTSWTLLSSTANHAFASFSSGWQNIFTVDTDPSNATEAEVYAANSDGIFRSTDGGATWTNVLGTTGNQGFSDVKVLASGVVYATLGSGFNTAAENAGVSPVSAPGIWRSPDGIVWTRISNLSGFPEANAERIELDVQINGAIENAFFLASAPGAAGNVKGGRALAPCLQHRHERPHLDEPHGQHPEPGRPQYEQLSV